MQKRQTLKIGGRRFSIQRRETGGGASPEKEIAMNARWWECFRVDPETSLQRNQDTAASEELGLQKEIKNGGRFCDQNQENKLAERR